MDNTIREKLPYGGDVADGSIPGAMALYGDAPILRNHMTVFARAQDEEGRLPHEALGAIPPAFSGHSFRTGFWLTEYAYWCEDQTFYRETIWPTIPRLLGEMARRHHENGMVVQPNHFTHLWVDWCGRMLVPGRTVPYPVKDGALSVPINLIYCSLLERAAEVAASFGETDDAAQWREQAGRIKEVIYNDFWDEERGLYMDGAVKGYLSSSYSEHANYVALLHGLGRDGRGERILTALNDPEQVGTITQFNAPFAFWPPKALFAIGEDKAALDTIRSRYSRFLRMGLDTFAEEWTWCSGQNSWATRYRSSAQNGAGAPAYHLLESVLGVKPLKPGFTEFEVAPQPGDLEWAEGIVPSPKGDIPVSWKIEDGTFTLELTVPEGSRAQVRLPGETETRTLEPGKHSLRQDPFVSKRTNGDME
jgi:hypothetical protein